jgi:hypothetical protein
MILLNNSFDTKPSDKSLKQRWNRSWYAWLTLKIGVQEIFLSPAGFINIERLYTIQTEA